MKAVWAAAALLIGLGLLVSYAVTRPRQVWIFEFRTSTALLREVEFPSGTAREALIPVLRTALEESQSSSLSVPFIVLRWADEKRTRSWVPSWPPLRIARQSDTVGKLILLKRPDGRWDIPADGWSVEMSFASSEQAVDEALRRLLPPD